jgi:hypothetical protein
MDDRESASLYECHGDLLASIAMDRFGVNSEAADKLALEVCLSALHNSRAKTHVRAWLIGAMVCAGREHDSSGD